MMIQAKMTAARRRLNQIAETLLTPGPVAALDRAPGTSGPDLAVLDPNNLNSYNKSLLGLPRLAHRPDGVDRGYDMSGWTQMELLRRAQSLGAGDEQLDRCMEETNTKAALLELVRSLEPPPPESAKIEDMTVEATASVDEMVARLLTFGAVIIKNAADPKLIDQVDAEVEVAGGWNKNPTKALVPGRDAVGMRAGMELLLKAPSLEGLYAHKIVLDAVKGLLGPYGRRIALKEMETFAVQPGQGKQLFHREDAFWPWHHEPHPWAVDVLWAVDDFTPENGGTRLLPYSHLGRIREEGREHQEDSYDESQVMKVSMPRGSVLIFTGAMVHGGGTNTTDTKRKSVLLGYQLGWLRPENKFHAYKPLHDALLAGQFSDEFAKLLGHADRSTENEGWTGTRRYDAYNGRRAGQARSDSGMGEGELPRPHLFGEKGFEPL